MTAGIQGLCKRFKNVYPCLSLVDGAIRALEDSSSSLIIFSNSDISNPLTLDLVN